MTKVAIIEDSLRDIEILKIILEEHCEGLTIVGVAKNLEDAVELITESEPDVVFLDVEIPPYNGFDVINALTEISFKIIFTTSHEKYALQAIKFSALDYLLKPLKIADVKAALAKISPVNHSAKQMKDLIPFLEQYLQNKDKSAAKIVLPDGEGYRLVKLEEIVYCEASNSYTKIHLQNNKISLISKPLRDYEELLKDKGFYRVHKSYIINMSHVARIIKKDSPAVIMSNNEMIPIASRKKNRFLNHLDGVIDV